MIDSVKPEYGKDVCNSEIDPDERESRKTVRKEFIITFIPNLIQQI